MDMFSNQTTGVITVLYILGFMIIANILRRKIPFIRKSLMPTAVVGGLLALIIKEVIRLAWGIDIFSADMLSALIYHLLPVGFIALGLRDKDDFEEGAGAKTSSKYKAAAPFRTGGVIVGTYMFQAVLAIGLTIVIGAIFFPDNALFKGIGITFPLGFGQGPGQAWNAGIIFDKAAAEAAGTETVGTLWRSFGLAVAGLGFLWASIGGVIMLNVIAKKKKIKLDFDSPANKGQKVSSSMVEQADEIPLTVGIDKFTMQVCLVGIVYLMTFVVCWLLDLLLNALPLGTLGSEVASVFWGFNFCFGIALALLVKFILKRLRKDKLMTRRYPNTYMLNRIAGTAFDIMIICALASIEIFALGILWVPMLIISVVIGLGTLYYLRFVCKKVYTGYSDEAFVTMYGTLTGTVSNGIILLRELDPKFETPAAMDQVIGSTTALVFGIPLLVLIGMSPQQPYLVMGICAAYFIFLSWVMFGKFGWLSKLFKRKKKAAAGASGAAITADAADPGGGETVITIDAADTGDKESGE